MSKTYRGFKQTKGYERRSRPRRERSDYPSRSQQTGDISTYCTLNLETGEVYNCKNMDHACAAAFGSNKRTQTHNWLAIYRGSDCFICL